jgi:transglycosylase-like protein
MRTLPTRWLGDRLQHWSAAGELVALSSIFGRPKSVHGSPPYRQSWGQWRRHLPEPAPRDEQIRVAKYIMATQGPKAWPKCASAPGTI